MNTAETDENPIAELQELIEKSGEEAAKLFGVALTIYAGQSAAAKDERQKRAELEKVILGN